jgi:hypothetical protein
VRSASSGSDPAGSAAGASGTSSASVGSGATIGGGGGSGLAVATKRRRRREGGRWRGRRVGSEGKCRQAGRREEGLERAGEGVGRTAQELFTAVSSLDPFLFRFVS